MGSSPVVTSDVLSAILGAGEAISLFRVTLHVVCCHFPLLSAISWSTPLDIPSGAFGRFPRSLG